jgi:hypothetical protein
MNGELKITLLQSYVQQRYVKLKDYRQEATLSTLTWYIAITKHEKGYLTMAIIARSGIGEAKEMTALEEFEKIGFWNMRCVQISLKEEARMKQIPMEANLQMPQERPRAELRVRQDLIECFIGGIIVSLVVGLVTGLVAGIVVGLIADFVAGIVAGLVVGIVVGLMWSLIVSLGMSLAAILAGVMYLYLKLKQKIANIKKDKGGKG